MIQVARGAARRILNSVARLHLKRRGEKGALISFLFHHLFRNRRESESELLSPLERITVDELRIIVEHFLERGYRFIGPDRVGNGHKLDGGRHYVMLTFDDGYYSTVRALSVLEESDLNSPAQAQLDAFRQSGRRYTIQCPHCRKVYSWTPDLNLVDALCTQCNRTYPGEFGQPVE